MGQKEDAERCGGEADDIELGKIVERLRRCNKGSKQQLAIIEGDT